jgi:P27 family predicted phage terminase small subunit
MGRRGPPPTPTKILEMRGSRRANKREGEPDPPAGRPRCPSWLDAEAKACWRQLVPDLEAMGILGRIDQKPLARYCQLWARWRRAEEFIQKHGEAYPLKDERGQVKCLVQFPQVAIAHKLSLALSRIEAEYGMTPSARARINVRLPERVTEMDERMKRLLGF